MTAAHDPGVQVLALCPECRDVQQSSRYVQSVNRCSTCNVPRRLALITQAGRREPLLTEDALHRQLHVIAESRNGQVGQRYLEREEPALLANCLAHAGSYRGARRGLRRWLGRHRGSPPAATEPESFPFWSAREADGAGPACAPSGSSQAPSKQTAQIAAIALRVRSRAPGLDDRCPYCHDVFEDADNDGQPDHAFLCDCGALFHVECRVELERCTSLGCETAFDPVESNADNQSAEEPEVRVVPRRATENESAWTFTSSEASRIGWGITAAALVAVAALIYTLVTVFK